MHADQDPEAKYEALEKYARDLTQAARDGLLDPVIGRDDEVRRCIQILSRRRKNNPVLIGEPGVGKTAVAEALAQRIVAGDVPTALEGRSLMSLDLGALIAGACTLCGTPVSLLPCVLCRVPGGVRAHHTERSRTCSRYRLCGQRGPSQHVTARHSTV